MNLEDLKPGESWACKFKVVTFLDTDGNVIDKNVSVGEKHPGVPGVYESLGIIQVRDLDSNLVKLLDTKTNKEFCVNWEDCWDADVIEWTEDA
jgi:hypothetical protein